jgi:hypothetical protein
MHQAHAQGMYISPPVTSDILNPSYLMSPAQVSQFGPMRKRSGSVTSSPGASGGSPSAYAHPYYMSPPSPSPSYLSSLSSNSDDSGYSDPRSFPQPLRRESPPRSSADTAHRRDTLSKRPAFGTTQKCFSTDFVKMKVDHVVCGWNDSASGTVCGAICASSDIRRHVSDHSARYIASGGRVDAEGRIACPWVDDRADGSGGRMFCEGRFALSGPELGSHVAHRHCKVNMVKCMQCGKPMARKPSHVGGHVPLAA